MMDKGDTDSVIVRFLDHYQEFGSLGHLVAAQAMVTTIESSTDITQRKLLAVKIFGEFSSAVEELGALCVAIRHRNDNTGLVYAYLTYGQRRNHHAPQTTIPDMFDQLRRGDGLVTALGLPSLDSILQADPSLAKSLLPRAYNETNKLLAMASEFYLTDDRAAVRAYNKTKHGFSVIDDPYMATDLAPEWKESICWILADNPEFARGSVANASRYELWKVSLDDVMPMLERIGTIRGAVMSLCGLMVELLRSGLTTAEFHSNAQ